MQFLRARSILGHCRRYHIYIYRRKTVALPRTTAAGYLRRKLCVRRCTGRRRRPGGLGNKNDVELINSARTRGGRGRHERPTARFRAILDFIRSGKERLLGEHFRPPPSNREDARFNVGIRRRRLAGASERY